MTWLTEEGEGFTVEASGNHVYFYAAVNTDRALALIQKVSEIDRDLVAERALRDLPHDFPHVPIWLHMNSGGGGIFAAFGLIDRLNTIKSPIYTIAEGFAASAASLLWLAGKRRYITPNALVCIHQLSTGFWGTYEQMKDDIVANDLLMERITSFYVSHSNLRRGQVQKMLQRDTWLTPQQCLEFGLAHEILK